MWIESHPEIFVKVWVYAPLKLISCPFHIYESHVVIDDCPELLLLMVTNKVWIESQPETFVNVWL